MPETVFAEAIATPVAAYEEGLRFFRGQGIMNNTLKRLVADLEDQSIDYCVIGAVALNQHGYRRFTEDIDLLFSPEGLERFRQTLVGRGYWPAFPNASKKFRSTADGAPVEIITSGEYPSDGQPKPVRFPDPSEVSILIDSVRTLTQERLVELKLASGMTGLGRLKIWPTCRKSSGSKVWTPALPNASHPT
jgi:hypothetical protein